MITNAHRYLPTRAYMSEVGSTAAGRRLPPKGVNAIGIIAVPFSMPAYPAAI